MGNWWRLFFRTYRMWPKRERGWLPDMTKEQWLDRYAKRSRMSVAELRLLGQDAYPCQCGEDDCEGWQCLSRETAERNMRVMGRY